MASSCKAANSVRGASPARTVVGAGKEKRKPNLDDAIRRSKYAKSEIGEECLDIAK